MATKPTNTTIVNTMSAEQISAVGITGTGRGLLQPVRIEVNVRNAQNQEQQQWVREPGQGPATHIVKPNTKIAVRIDGQDITGNQKVQGQGIKLKKVNADLLIETEAGETLVYLDDFFQATDVMLQGADWSFTGTDSLRLANASEGVMAGTNLIAASSSAGWLGGGLGLAAAAASGGGGTAAVVAEVFKKLAITVVAGPVNTKLTALVYTADGTLLGAYETDASGKVEVTLSKDGKAYTGALMVKVMDLNKADGTGYVDEATGASKDFNVDLRALAVAEGKDLAITVSPATEMAAKLALGANASPSASSPLTTTAVTTNNAKVASSLGLTSILGAATPVISTAGGANGAYNETDGISEAEKYGQVLAMLSGKDSVTGSTSSTIDQFVAALNGTAPAAAVSDLLYAGAKAFEFGTNTTQGTATTAGLANLLSSDGKAAAGSTLAAIPRTISAPPDYLLTKATNAMATGDLALAADGKRYVSAAEAADGIVVPTALPPGTVVGDKVTLSLPKAGTDPVEYITIEHVLTAADVQSGVANVAISASQLQTAGDGTKAVTAAATITSADGTLTSPSYTAATFQLDMSAPLPVAASDVAGLDATPGINTTGTRDRANFTSDKTPTLKGKVNAADLTAADGFSGAVVEILLNGKIYRSTDNPSAITLTKDASGNYTGDYTFTVPEADALSGAGGAGVAYTPVITVIDAAGNKTSQTGTPFAVYVDATAVLAAGSDSAGAGLRSASDAASVGSATDTVTNIQKPSLQGIVPVGTSVLEIEIGGRKYSTAFATTPGTLAGGITLNAATGAWSLTVTQDLLDGTYTPILKLTDIAGTVATVNGKDFTIDATAPSGLAANLQVDTVTTMSANDTGIKADNVTADATPTLSGRGEPGTSVLVTLKKTGAADVPLSAVIVGADGTWVVTVPNALADGQWTPSIVATDAAGNSNVATNGTAFTIDTTAPVAASGAIIVSSDTGNGLAGTATDNLSKVKLPELAGTAEAGTKVEVTLNANAFNQTYTTTAAADGTWKIQVAHDMPEGSYTPAITLTDAAGNTTPSSGTPFTIDFTAPLAADIAGELKKSDTASNSANAALDALNSDTATTTDNLTNVRLPVLTGTAEAGSRVQVIVNGKTHEATLTGTTWTVTVGGQDNAGAGLNDGFYEPQIVVTDAAGNATSKAGTAFQIDTAAPLTAAITGALTIDADSDNNTANDNDSATKADNLTRDTTPTLSGTAEAGSTVVVTLKKTGATDVVLPAVKVGTDGTWSVTSTALADGTWTPSIAATDAAGNTSSKDGTPLTIDATAPSDAPSALSGKLGLVSDTGLANDNKTNQTTPTLTGKAEAGSVVTIVLNTKTYKTTADVDGNWSVTVPSADALTSAAGGGTEYAFTVSSTDAAGNVSQVDGSPFTVDTTPLDATAMLANGSDSAGPAGFTNGTNADNITNVSTPVITGAIANYTTTAAGSSIEVTLNGVVYSSSSTTPAITIQADGTWTFTAQTLPAGDHIPKLKIISSSGVPKEINGTGFRVDTTAPSFGISGALQIDTDTNNDLSDDNDSATKGDKLTRDTTPTLVGTAEAGATVTITLKDTTPGRTTPLADVVLTSVLAGNDGSWSATATTLADGQWTPSIVVTDIAGNATAAVNGTAFTVDRTVPVNATGGLNAASDTGNGLATTATDNRTNLPKPVLAGTAEAGAKVEVTLNANGFNKTYTTTANDSGAWTVTVADAMPEGSYTPSIKTTDAAGNTSTASGTLFTIDLTAPVATSISGALETGATATTNTGSNADQLTNARLPVLRGTTDLATDKVEVTVNGKTYAATVAADKSWSVTIGAQDNSGAGLNNGYYTPQIKVTDAAGNVTLKDGTQFQIDYSAPVAASISGALTIDTATAPNTGNPSDNDSGTKGDNLTRDTTPAISGLGEAGASVVVTLKKSGSPDVALPAVTVAADGTWAVNSTALSDGTWTPSIAMTDPAGNVTTKDGTAFTVDSTVPTTPTGALAASSDSGALDNTTNDRTPTLSGTAEAGSKVEVSLYGKTYTTTADSSTGAWSVTVPDTDANRLPATTTSYTAVITTTDAAGNVSTANATAFTIDTSAPVANGALDKGATAATNTGTDKTDNLTSSPVPVIKGSAAPGAKVSVTVDSVIYSATADGSGNWSITVGTGGKKADGTAATQALTDGTYIPRITVTDTVGNATTVDGTEFKVDRTAPADVTIRAALQVDTDTNSNTADDNDSGTKADNTTNDTTPTLTGFAEAGTSVVVTLKKSGATDVVLPAVTVAADGTWSVTSTALAQGTWTPYVVATDAAGNASASVAGTPVTIDTTGPSVDMTVYNSKNANTTAAATAALAVGETATLLFTFTEDPGSSFDVADLTFTTTAGASKSLSDYGTVGALSGSGLTRQVIFTPKSPLAEVARITIANGAFTDAAGNTNVDTAAANTNNTIDIQISTVAPVVTGIAISGTATDGTTSKTTLKDGDKVFVDIAFDQLLTVTGTPVYFIEMNGLPKQASYTGKTDTASASTLRFEYVVANGDNDGQLTAGAYVVNGGITAASNSLSLNGGSIRSTAGNTANISTVATGGAGFSANALIVDTTAPTVAITASSIKLNAESGSTASTVTFSFSEDPGSSFMLADVVVTDGAATPATLVSGTDYTWGTISGTGLTRTATFTPKSGYTGAMVLGIANTKFTDAAGNNNADGTDANNTLSIAVDTQAPAKASATAVSISGLDASDAAKATALVRGDKVKVTLLMDEAVTVVGKPEYTIVVGSANKQAIYSADLSAAADATGKTLVFTYTVQNNDLDAATGITSAATAVTLPALVTIRDAAGNNASLAVPAIAASANTVAVDAVKPVLQSLVFTENAGTDDTFVHGNMVTITANFDAPVNVSVTSGANRPYVNLKVGSSTVPAYYSSGTGTNALVFTYTINSATNDTDTNGLSLAASALSLGDGAATITDAAGNEATLTLAAVLDNGNLLVDTTVPTLEITRATTVTLNKGSSETITFNFSEDPGSSFDLADVVVKNGSTALTSGYKRADGNVYLALTGGTAVTTGYDFVWGVMGTSGKNRSATFTYKDGVELADVNFSVATAQFVDAASNANTAASNTLSMAVDTLSPVLSSIALSDAKLTKNGETIEAATLTFTFTEDPGTSFITSDIAVLEGGAAIDVGLYGTLGAVTGTSGLTRTVVFTPFDRKSADLKFSVAGSKFKDAALNDNITTVESSVLKVATAAPAVKTVTLSKTDSFNTNDSSPYTNALVAGDKVTVTVEYTAVVKLTAGTPTFDFFVGSGKRTATLVTTDTVSTAKATAGGKFLVFEYTVPVNTNSATYDDGAITVSSGAMQTAGVTLVDASDATVNADVTTPTSVLTDFATKAYVADNTLPTVAISIDAGVSTVQFTDVDGVADVKPTIRFTFSEAPKNFAKAQVTVTGGGTISDVVLVSGTDGKVYTAEYNAPAAASAIDLTTVSFQVASTAQVRDASGNANGLASNTVNLAVDTKQPAISSLAIASAGTNNFYNTGDTIVFDATFQENVFVTGFGTSAPYLEFSVGADTKRAYYSVGTGTNTLSFSYLVEAGTTDADGISYAANKIVLNSQTIKDQMGNAADLSHALLANANATAHKVDTTVPTVTLSAAGSLSALKKDQTVEIEFKFSEDPFNFTWDGTTGDVTLSAGTLGALGSKITNGDGTFSYKATYAPPTNAPAGTLVSLSVGAAKFTDTAGNDNPVSNTLNFTVDTAPPAAVTLTLAADTFNSLDTVPNQAIHTADKITSNTALTLGAVESGAAALLKVEKAGVVQQVGGQDWITQAQYNTLMATAAQGTYTVTAKQTDAAGNEGPTTGTITLTKDTVAANNLVTALTTNTLGAAVKVGGGNFGTAADRYTSNAAFSVVPTEAGAIVEYKVGSSAWSTTYTAPTTDGDKVVLVRQTDKAGNVSAEQTFEFTLDTTAPSISSLSGALAVSEDTGDNTIDRLTNGTGGSGESAGSKTYITLEGLSEAGTYVKVAIKSADGTTTVDTYEATTDANTGAWSVNVPTSALTDGNTYTYDITSVDLAGNSRTKDAATYATQTFKVDFTAPTVGNISGKLASTSDTGTLDNDNRTNATTPTLTGNAEAKAKVDLRINSKTYTTYADNDGKWSVKVEDALTDDSAAGTTATELGGKTVTYELDVTDAAGNKTTKTGLSFVLDTKATTLSLISGAMVQEAFYDTGLLFNDGITKNTKPKFEGLAEANAKVRVTVGGVNYDTTASSLGQWSITVTNPLPEGEHTPLITVTDAAGNVAEKYGTALTIDTTAPTRSLITSSPLSGSQKPTISGTGEAGSNVQVELTSSVSGEKGRFITTVQANGTWSVNTLELKDENTGNTGTFTTPANGNVTVTAYAYDAAGNNSTPATQTLVVDTAAPAAPTITSTASTSDLTPSVVGTGEAGATVTLKVTINGTDFFYTGVVAADGKWTIDMGTAAPKDSAGQPATLPTLADGNSLSLSVSQKDTAGNVQTAPAATQSLTIDQGMPTVTQVYDFSGLPTHGMTTNDASPIIEGTATANSTVTVKVTGKAGAEITYTNVAVNSSGVWAINTGTDQRKNAGGNWEAATPTGTWGLVEQSGGAAYTVVVTQAAKQSTATITLDIVTPAVGFNSNPIATDDVLNFSEIGAALTGTAEAGTTVQVRFTNTSGVTEVRSATVLADGTWTYSLTTQDITLLGQSAKGSTGPTADKTLTVRATDPAGNYSDVSRLIAIDTVLPTLDLNRADDLTRNWAVPLLDGSEYSLDNGADVNTTAAELLDTQSVNKITVAIPVAQLLNGADEKLSIGDVSLNANGSGLPASVLFAGVTWNVLYSAGVFSFTAASVPASTAPAQAFIRNLRYQNKATSINTGGDRVFTINVYDTAGNKSADVTSIMTNDQTGPLMDLDGNDATSINRRVLNATAVDAAAGVLLTVGTPVITEQNRIARFEIQASGLVDGTSEKLRVGSTDLNANGSTLPETVSDGTNTWAVSYDTASAKFIFNLAAGSATKEQGVQLLAALSYKNVAATPTEGARNFEIKAVDSVNNVTATAAVATVAINGTAPTMAAEVTAVFTPAAGATVASNSTGRVTTLDADGNGVLGDQFILAFSENVQTSLVTDKTKWTASAGSLSGATITALEPVTFKNALGVDVTYAKRFLFTGATGYTTGTTFSIANANVRDTGDTPAAEAGGNVVFAMTDIVAPLAATPPLNINQNGATSPNVINAAEKAATTTVGTFTLAAAAETGDVLKVFMDGVYMTGKDVTLTAGAATASFNLSDADWGSIDGPKTLTTRIQDKAGNLGDPSSPKTVLLDTGIANGIKAMVVTSDTGTVGAANADDKVQITFNEAVNITTGSLSAGIFGTTGLAVAAVGGTPTAGVTGSNIKSSVWEITLGSGTTLAGGQPLSFTGVTDDAGNTQARNASTGVLENLTATVPADVFNAPSTILINNVTSDNVLTSAERASVSSVGVTLAGAKKDDEIKLYMGGVEVGTATVANDGDTAVTVNFNSGFSWGADGERSLTASIKRGSNGTLVNSDTRSVNVAADSAHWSAGSGMIWFDADSVVQASGSSVLTWNASVGGSVATVDTSVVTNDLYRPKLVRRAVNGRNQIYFNGGLQNGNDTVAGSWMNFTDPNTFFALNTSNRAYTLINNAQFAQTGNWRYTTSIGSYGQALGAGAVGFGVESSGTALFALQHSAGVVPPNSNSLGTQILASHVYSPGALQLYANGQLIGSKSGNYSIILGAGTAAQQQDQYVIGGTVGGTGNGGGVMELWKGMIGDIIWANRAITGNELLEINTYEAVKFATTGTKKAATAEGATYDLSGSANSKVLLDEVLTLHNTALGKGNDTVTTAGADYVSTGAGADLVKAKDLSFRQIDGGTGYDSFALDSSFAGGTFILTDYVSNARGQGEVSADNTRVNANGYHKLLGFEKLDFSLSTTKQMVTIAAADVDQLAEKNLSTDPQKAANTSNLYVALGSNDYLTPTGFGAVQYGYWLDAAGTAYDRKYTTTLAADAAGISNTANLFARSGDDAPDFGFTSSVATYGPTSVAFDFSETMSVATLTKGQFSINGAAATSASMTSGSLSLGLSTGGLSGIVRVQYSGTAIQDSELDQLRYKDMTIGSEFSDTLDASARATNQALFGGAGGDTITGGSADDLLLGMSGNDVLAGGLGADTFRFIQFENGTDKIEDFTKTQGDKLDLRGILKDSGFDSGATLSNINLYLNLVKVGNDVQLKIDDQGIGNFTVPSQTVILTSAASGTSNLYDGAALVSLSTLIDQRVILV